MTTRGWGPRTGLVGLFSMLLLVEGSPSVLANGIIIPFYVPALIAIINFPVNAMLLLVMYHLFARRQGVSERLGEGRFIELFMLSTLVITITGAMIDLLLLLGPGPSLWFGMAIVIGCIVFKTVTFILRISDRWGAYTALAFFGLNVVLWPLLSDLRFGLENLVAILLLLYVLTPVLLIRLAYQYHSLVIVVENEGSVLQDRFIDTEARSQIREKTGDVIWMGRLIVSLLLVVLLLISFNPPFS
jgi:hypothetical protein